MKKYFRLGFIAGLIGGAAAAAASWRDRQPAPAVAAPDHEWQAARSRLPVTPLVAEPEPEPVVTVAAEAEPEPVVARPNYAATMETVLQRAREMSLVSAASVVDQPAARSITEEFGFDEWINSPAAIPTYSPPPGKLPSLFTSATVQPILMPSLSPLPEPTVPSTNGDSRGDPWDIDVEALFDFDLAEISRDVNLDESDAPDAPAVVSSPALNRNRSALSRLRNDTRAMVSSPPTVIVHEVPELADDSPAEPEAEDELEDAELEDAELEDAELDTELEDTELEDTELEDAELDEVDEPDDHVEDVRAFTSGDAEADEGFGDAYDDAYADPNEETEAKIIDEIWGSPEPAPVATAEPIIDLPLPHADDGGTEDDRPVAPIRARRAPLQAADPEGSDEDDGIPGIYGSFDDALAGIDNVLVEDEDDEYVVEDEDDEYDDEYPVSGDEHEYEDEVDDVEPEPEAERKSLLDPANRPAFRRDRLSSSAQQHVIPGQEPDLEEEPEPVAAAPADDDDEHYAEAQYEPHLEPEDVPEPPRSSIPVRSGRRAAPPSGSAATQRRTPPRRTPPAVPTATRPEVMPDVVDVIDVIDGDEDWEYVPVFIPGDGTAGVPETHPIKVKVSSGIYHMPGMLNYDRTIADKCYISAEEADEDGFRPAKR